MAAHAVAQGLAQVPAAVPAVDWEGGVSRAWGSVITFVPKLLIFLLVLVVGWLVAKALQKLVVAVLERVGFARLLQRAGVDRYFPSSGGQEGSHGGIVLIAKIVYYFVLLVALQLALSAFGPTNPVSQIVDRILAWLPRLVIAIVIVIVAAAVANAVRDVLRTALGSLSYGRMLSNLAAWFIIAIGVIAALGQVGIALSVTLPVLIAALATIGGILVVGVGGGLIRPMQSRWESWLARAEEESKVIAETAAANRSTAPSMAYDSTYPQGQPGYPQPGEAYQSQQGAGYSQQGETYPPQGESYPPQGETYPHPQGQQYPDNPQPDATQEYPRDPRYDR